MKRKNINKKMLIGLEKVDQSLQFLLFGKKVDNETIRNCNPIQVEKYEKMQVIARKPIYYLIYNTQLTKFMIDNIYDMYNVNDVKLYFTYSDNAVLEIELFNYKMTYLFNLKSSRWYENAYQELVRIDIKPIKK